MSAIDDALVEALGVYEMIVTVPGDTSVFRAILARYGLAVLPVEPTREMVRAAPGRPNQATEESMYHGIYRAMLAASQAPALTGKSLFGSMPSDETEEEVEAFLREIS